MKTPTVGDVRGFKEACALFLGLKPRWKKWQKLARRQVVHQFFGLKRTAKVASVALFVFALAAVAADPKPTRGQVPVAIIPPTQQTTAWTQADRLYYGVRNATCPKCKAAGQRLVSYAAKYEPAADWYDFKCGACGNRWQRTEPHK